MARTYFPEVQALRAIAVVMVVVYHLQPRALSGGFIGVDVFFVISGYLITGHLLREYRRHGRISLASFWAARARRILPAALLCIVVTGVVILMVYPPTQWARLGQHLMASALSVENWLLARDSVDYLASMNDPSPLQHFWSLGVEEQFYVLWPFIVLAGLVLAARRARWMLGGVIATVVLAGFAWSVFSVASGDLAAYFSTTTRVWELGVGGLLAVMVPSIRLSGAARTALSWSGIALIAVGGVALSGGDPFPGALALIPVLGASAVIAAGATSGALAPASLYGLRPVQWVGNVSYSLYLWHFPPIVFFTVLRGRAPGWAWSIALAGGAVGAAWLSQKYIEDPVRRNAWLSAVPRRSLVMGGVSIATVTALALVLPLSEQRAQTSWVATASALSAEGVEGAAAMTRTGDPAFVDGKTGITPAPTRAGSDQQHSVPGDCMVKPQAAHTPRCIVGDTNGGVTVALVGDSHAMQLSPAIVSIAKERGWRVQTYLHSSCPFNDERRILEAEDKSVCAGPNAETLAALLAHPPQIVFLANWASGDFENTHTGHAPGVAGFAKIWSALVAAGSQVVVFKDVPKPLFRPIAADCVAKHYASPRACAVPRAEALKGRSIVNQAAQLVPAVHIIDLTDRLCTDTICPAVIGNVLVYRDSNHLTDTFVRTLIPYIDERLPAHLRTL